MSEGELDLGVVELLDVVALAECCRDDSSLDDLDAREAHAVSRPHFLQQRGSMRPNVSITYPRCQPKGPSNSRKVTAAEFIILSPSIFSPWMRTAEEDMVGSNDCCGSPMSPEAVEACAAVCIRQCCLDVEHACLQAERKAVCIKDYVLYRGQQAFRTRLQQSVLHLVHLLHSPIQSHIPVLLVHVVVASARLVSDPDAKVFHSRGLLLEDLRRKGPQQDPVGCALVNISCAFAL